VLPRRVPAGGDLKHFAHGGDRGVGLAALHEFESRDGIDVLSLANQAAAFLRIASARPRCGKDESLRSRVQSDLANVHARPALVRTFFSCAKCRLY